MIDLSVHLPEFIIVGAAKSGTSSLHRYLQEHPRIYMPSLKELNYLHTHGVEKDLAILKRVPEMPTNETAYASHFYEAEEGQIKGEASPSYLIYHERTIANIKQFYKNRSQPKIIIILREPIDKIWSHYKFNKKYQLDPDGLSIRKAIAAEPDRLADTSYLPDVHYWHNTQYYTQVKAYLDHFEDVKVVLFDELHQDAEQLIFELHDFLGVERILPEGLKIKHNQSDAAIVPTNKYVAWAMKMRLTSIPVPFKSYLKSKLLKKEQMDSATRNQLVGLFKPEVERLQTLLDKDLSSWLAGYKD